MVCAWLNHGRVAAQKRGHVVFMRIKTLSAFQPFKYFLRIN